MEDVLRTVTRLAMLAFLVTGMLELGLTLSVRQVLVPLKSPRIVIVSLAANFLVAPLLAFGLAKLLRLEPPFAIGLLLLGLTPGAPFIPKVVQLAKGDPGIAVGLMVLLMVGTVGTMPWVLPLVLEGTQVNAWKIEQSLLLLILLPLAVGLALHMWFPSQVPAWLHPSLGLVSNLSAGVVLVLIVTLNLRSMLGLFGSRAVLAGFLLVALSTLTGWLLGGGDPRIRDAVGLATGLRNVAVALLVGAENFSDPRVNVMVVASALVGLSFLIPVARGLGRRA